MMYRIIGQALEKAGLSECNHPRDFLNFYCLGQREPELEENLSLANNPSENSALVCFLLLFYFVLKLLDLVNIKKIVTSSFNVHVLSFKPMHFFFYL